MNQLATETIPARTKSLLAPPPIPNSYGELIRAAEIFTKDDQWELSLIQHELDRRSNRPEMAGVPFFTRLPTETLETKQHELEQARQYLRVKFEAWLNDSQKFNFAEHHGRLYHAELGKKEALKNRERRANGETGVLDEDLETYGIANLLSTPEDQFVEIYHLNDVIADGDLAKSRIEVREDILGQKFGAMFHVRFEGSEPGRSLHTGVHALQLMGQHRDICERDRVVGKPMTILINNADRSKHNGKEKAQGSNCLWARVKDPSSGTIHNVVGVDHEAFAPFKHWIVDLYEVIGIPDDPFYHDLSNGTQFRSLHNFPFVQALTALTGGAPAGFNTKKLSLEEIPDLELSGNEAILGDRDRFGNCKLLTSHKNGVIGLAHELNVDLDAESVFVQFIDENGDVLYEGEFISTRDLGKHAGKECVWNGSSRDLDNRPFIEIGISKAYAEQEIPELKNIPISTRMVFYRNQAEAEVSKTRNEFSKNLSL